MLFDDNAATGGGTNEEGAKDYRALYEALQAKFSLETETFNKRLGGLQQTLQAEQNAHKQTKDTLASVQNEFTGLQKTKAELEAEKASLATEKENLFAQFTSTDTDLKRIKLVMEKFPNLASFEGKGLLPKVDDLSQAEKVYSEFQASLDQIAKNANVSAQRSGVPELPARKEEAKPKSAELKKAATDHALHGRENEYNETMKEYYKVVEEESAAKKAVST
jgi:chromosome segregation ATPase